MNKLTKFINDPLSAVRHISYKGAFNWMSDKMYLKLMYRANLKKKLNLDNPQTLNEKLQWLKLYDRNPEHTTLVDKYAVREYIKKELGEEYLIPLLGVWDSPEEIDFDALPDKFVLKCNHNSGTGMCICTDKSKLNIEQVKKDLRKGLAEDYYIQNREWPYKNVKRKIIAEQYMQDEATNELRDYKFFCFDGYADCVMVCMERNTDDTKYYFFDKEWKLLRLNKRGAAAPKDFTISKPAGMDEMFEIAARLSEGMRFARIDLYYCNGKIYFGEITFFPDSGFDGNILPETDKYFGGLIKL